MKKLDPDSEGAWSDAGSKFQEFLKADPAHGEIPYPEIWDAFKQWIERQDGKGTVQ